MPLTSGYTLPDAIQDFLRFRALGARGNSRGPRTGARETTDRPSRSGYADRRPPCFIASAGLTVAADSAPPGGFPAAWLLRMGGHLRDRWRGTTDFGTSKPGDTGENRRLPGRAEQLARGPQA